MKRHQTFDINIRDSVAIRKKKRIVTYIFFCSSDPASRHGLQSSFKECDFPRLRSVIMNLHPIVTEVNRYITLVQKVICEIFLDVISLIAQQDHKLIKP